MSGPPPKKDGTRRTKGAMGYVLATLPAEGRKGRAPAWPFGGRAPKGWAELWRCPQAVMWEQMGSELAVARYLKLRNLIDGMVSIEVMKPAWFSELRQTEDALGLSPKGMQNLRWVIEGAEEKQEEQRGPGTGKTAEDRRRRLRIVDEDVG